MSAEQSERHPVDELAEDFVTRFRRGERPAISEYTSRFPELADQIAEVLQALVLMEELSPGRRPPDSSFDNPLPAGVPPLRRLGEYRILREVGRGGMGVVYEAEQESLGRHVALKVLPAAPLLGPTRLERFRREAQTAARLHHTNIVPVFGVGEQDGVHYYAMQYIRGQGLDEVLQELKRMRTSKEPTCDSPAGVDARAARSASLARSLLQDAADAPVLPAPPDRTRWDSEQSSGAASARAKEVALNSSLPTPTQFRSGTGASQPYYQSVARVGLQVAEALAYAHGLGVVHRDIKPSNLLLDTQGTIWVTDFGLAKAEGMDELTHTGDVVGTLRYMAPERFAGTTDPRSDIYSLGLALYEMLTLRAAFPETDRARLLKLVMHEDPPRPRSLDRRIPRDLETVVLKASAREPERRYRTAGELAEDLRRFLADQPVRARRTSARERLWRWCRRNPALASVTAAVAVLLLAIAAVTSLAALWLRQERKATDEQLRLTRQAEREGRQRLYEARRVQGKASRLSGRIGQRLESLEALAEAARLMPDLDFSPQARQEAVHQLRNDAIAAMALIDLRLERDLGEVPAGTSAVAFDSALERYAHGTEEGVVTVRAVADNQALCHLPGRGMTVGRLWFSPDRRFLAVRYVQLSVYHLVVWDLTLRKVVLSLRSGNSEPTFSEDGRRLATTVADRTICLFDLPSGKQSKRLSLVPREIGQFAWRGDNLAVWDDEQHVRIVDIPTDQVVRKWRHPGLRAVAWHADKPVVATASDKEICLWDMADTTKPQATFPAHHVTAFWLVNNTGAQLVSTPDLWDWFGPEGPLLAIRQGSRLGIWRVVLSRERSTLFGHGGALWDADFSADGRLLVTGGPAEIRLWDPRGGVSVASLPVEGGAPVFFDPARCDLLVGSASGLWRWPVTAVIDPAPGLRVGPPRHLTLPVRWRRDRAGLTTAVTPNGRILVTMAGPDRGTVLALDRPAEPIVFGPHARLWSVAVSPDSRWVATGPWNSGRVCVWDATSGKLICNLAGTENVSRAVVAFSPDSRWLLTGSAREFRIWEVGTWTPGWVVPRETQSSVPGTVAFSPDGMILAITDSPRIKLIDPRSGTALAALPLQLMGFPVVRFSPDGSQLLVVQEQPQIWDLRRLRAQLAAMGLDWDRPPYPPAPDTMAPLQVQIEPGPGCAP
jgi:serine/threonine protein kinase/WD40 repeat protein